ncbi:hypothetical protein GALMADRAFT_1069259 [Galerina marginata CBS 339.88]|uniref:Uncharacterized protein n=1 Tax=Galerina marginata (strain CBS 339.88) TaxID=685588 RepID=A0A067SIS3_GALM3|nr:hypothetical protein GALMADRAFT_1069259 [Galerina marginata CBS 339.88]
MEDRRNRGETYDHKRLPSRPLVSGGTTHAVNGAAFEDLGTSLQAGTSRTTVNGGWGQSSSQVRSTAGQAQKFKPAPSRQPSPMPKSKYLSGQNAAGNRGYAASRSTSKKPTGQSKSVVDLDSDLSSSTDPMDLFSQPDYDVDPSTSQKPLVNHGKFKPPGCTTAAKSGQKSSSGQNKEDKKALEKKEKESQEVYIDPNGERHEYHPSFLPKKGKFAGMKISKNKVNHDESSQDASLPVSKSQEPISKENLSSKAYEPPRWADSMPGPSNRKKQEAFMDLTSPPKYAEDDSIVYVKHPSPLSGKSANSNRRLSPSPPRSRQPMLSRKPTTSENLAENTRFGPPKGRPLPRPIGRAALNAAEKEIPQSKQASQGPGSSQTRGGLSLTKALDIVPVASFYGWGESAKKRPESRGRSRSRSVSLECSSPKTIRKTKLEEFPVLSPPSSPPKPSAFPTMSPLRGAEPSPPPPKRSTMKRLASPSRVPSALPMPLPKPRRQDESKAKTQVKPSKANADKGKGKAKEISRPSDEDEEDMDSDYGKKNKKQSRQRKPKLKAFPMSTQVLASIGSSPSSSSQPFASRPGKRTSEGGSDDERVSKKFRMGRDSLLESPTRLPFEDEGDSMYRSACRPQHPLPLLRHTPSFKPHASSRENSRSH